MLCLIIYISGYPMMTVFLLTPLRLGGSALTLFSNFLSLTSLYLMRSFFHCPSRQVSVTWVLFSTALRRSLNIFLIIYGRAAINCTVRLICLNTLTGSPYCSHSLQNSPSYLKISYGSSHNLHLWLYSTFLAWVPCSGTTNLCDSYYDSDWGSFCLYPLS